MVINHVLTGMILQVTSSTRSSSPTTQVHRLCDATGFRGRIYTASVFAASEPLLESGGFGGVERWLLGGNRLTQPMAKIFWTFGDDEYLIGKMSSLNFYFMVAWRMGSQDGRKTCK